MKETKVYVDELPKCIFCPMLVNLSNIGESKELMCCLNRTAYCNDYSDIEELIEFRRLQNCRPVKVKIQIVGEDDE